MVQYRKKLEGCFLTNENVKKNNIGEKFILIGILLHLLNLIAIFTGIWGTLSNTALMLFTLATIPYVVGYLSIRKAPSTLWAIILILLSLFFTHYIVALFFVIGGALTIHASRKIKNAQNSNSFEKDREI